MTQIVLVIAAHPDDEVLGCGGTIARHIAEGDEVHVVYMADGVTARAAGNQKDIHKRNIAAEEACRVLGVVSTDYLNFPDNRMDSLPLLDIVQKLEEVIKRIKPAIIYTHHIGDLNIDHRITHQATLTACRPVPDHCVKQIFSFEVLSSTEWQTADFLPFLPTKFVNISTYLEKKISALKVYGEEIRPTPHSRSIENVNYLASYRGNTVGVTSAEAFVVVRDLR